MNPHEKLWYFINYAKRNCVLTHRSVEDSASPSHLRCPLCWITIPRTEQLGRRTVALRGWVLSCPGWSVQREARTGRECWEQVEGLSPASSQRILKPGKALLDASIYTWKVSPTGSFWTLGSQLVTLFWKSMNPLGGGASLEEGLGGLTVPSLVCSLLALTCEVTGPGCMLFPPWLPSPALHDGLCAFRSWAKISPPPLKLFSSSSLVPLKNIRQRRD